MRDESRVIPLGCERYSVTARNCPNDAAAQSGLPPHADTSDGERQSFPLIVRQADWNASEEAIVALRLSVAPELGPSDNDDATAPHFLAYRGTSLVGAVRVSFADVGPLDFEPILQIPIPELCRHELVSLSRFVVARKEARAIRLVLNQLIREAWRHSWARGCRASLVSAPEHMIAFYQRTIGSAPISKPRPHPRTGRPVRIMRHAPDPRGGGLADDVVASLGGASASPTFIAWLNDLESVDA